MTIKQWLYTLQNWSLTTRCSFPFYPEHCIGRFVILFLWFLSLIDKGAVFGLAGSLGEIISDQGLNFTEGLFFTSGPPWSEYWSKKQKIKELFVKKNNWQCFCIMLLGIKNLQSLNVQKDTELENAIYRLDSLIFNGGNMCTSLFLFCVD